METHHIRPEGPSASTAEAFRLSTLDHTVTHNYCTWALFFKLGDADTVERITEGFRHALALTLGQCRHYVGKIEKNAQRGEFSIVKSADSTVRLDVRRLDDHSHYPSFADLEKVDFSARSLGDLAALLAIEGMTMSCGAYPSHVGRDVSAFQLTFVRGGVIFTIHQHHLVGDIFAAASLARQLARNSVFVFKGGASPPSWDETLMDRSRFIAPREGIVQDPKPSAPIPQKHPDWLPCSWLLFHIRQDKIDELKRLATPSDDGTTAWISTYDAVVALVWRALTKNRATIYKPDLSSQAIFMESVNMRRRLDPPVPDDYQGNLFCAGLSFYQPDAPTIAEVISTAPLSRLAGFIRRVTQSVTAHTLEATLVAASALADKYTLHGRADSAPPMSLVVTDWRSAHFCTHDFGFGSGSGRPVVERLVSDTVVENAVVLYPPRVGAPSPGLEVLVPFETHAVQALIDDVEMKEFFEFRGIEATGP
ncbi:transferase family-domain-containing protein [Xylariaceae sp. FL0594]|nr:transferase family-domain-containing protein [Xylariaceae sp. FL0594]